MQKPSKIIITILIIVTCILGVYTTKFLIRRANKSRPMTEATRIKGEDNAPIKIMEFIDFQCPACAMGAAYLKEMTEKYPGAIRLELRHYPLQMHKHGYLSSRYAECAVRQGKFWSFHDLLLARQSNWQRLADAAPAFKQIAKDSHLDQQELDACLADDAVDKVIEKNREEGKALGVKSTPTYFVNGKLTVGKQALETAITELLKKNGY